MATVMTQRLPGGAQIYDRLNDAMDTENNLPSGLIHHYAAKDGDDMLIWDIWESRGDFERFMNERLMPAFQQVMGEAPDPNSMTQPTFAELHNEFSK
jgi:hypothetical protein